MTQDYSIPFETLSLLKDGIIRNISQRDLPIELAEAARQVEFEGSDLPSIAINWRFAESIAALKGFEAAMINVLLKRRYDHEYLPVTINTDHAQLLFMSSLLLQVEPGPHFEVNPTPVRELSAKYAQYFPQQDFHNFASSLYRRASTNIYRCKDGKFIHLHGSLNPNPTITALQFPLNRPEITTFEDAYQPYTDECLKHNALDLEETLNEEYRQACTVARPLEDYAQSEHGKANADVGLYEVHRRDFVGQNPGWWRAVEATSIQRPLAGLKVVDLTRVIAGPAISRGLAELGASVMRVTAPHLSDFTGLHPDLNWGKWNCCLDLRKEDDRTKLRDLITEADVVVDGYRPGVFEKYGFGVEGVMELCRDREVGVIYARENSYGRGNIGLGGSLSVTRFDTTLNLFGGLSANVSQNTGISFGFGRAMGREEPCTPVFPNSDYCTGVAGCVGVLEALIERGEQGGSYVVDIALNYYNQWLANVCGEYPKEVWEWVWSLNGRKCFRHFESMNITVPAYLAMMKEHAADDLLRPEFFERRRTEALGLEMQVVKPVLQFPAGTVELKYNIGTRGNGVDQPYWPGNLSQEVVK